MPDRRETKGVVTEYEVLLRRCSPRCRRRDLRNVLCYRCQPRRVKYPGCIDFVAEETIKPRALLPAVHFTREGDSKIGGGFIGSAVLIEQVKLAGAATEVRFGTAASGILP